MAITPDADGSEDVNDFLLRIRELGDQRDKEDEERTKKLEEDIIQGRKERQARRAERARSLSPTKDAPSNAGTSGLVQTRNDMPTQEDWSRTPSLHPTPAHGLSMTDAPRKTHSTASISNLQNPARRSQDSPQAPSKPHVLSNTSPSAAMPLARANTLSWQQRPSSHGPAGPRTRPSSMLASDNKPEKASRLDVEPTNIAEDNVPRSQIAQPLGSRDPSWFKQTQDRGLGSAAFRKSQVEDASDTNSATCTMRLPGMSRETTTELGQPGSSPPESVRSDSPSTHGSITNSSRANPNHPASDSFSSASNIHSPLPTLVSQRFEPPSSDTTSMSGEDSSSVGRTLAMSPSQGRIAPERTERPTSPTKGLGGFVQSAMLKRSDSVNKRWSAQAGPGLSRGNSTASNLNGYGASRYPVGGITPLTESKPNGISREGSPATHSRPTSSHSNNIVPHRLTENEKPGTSKLLSSNVSESRLNQDVLETIPPESILPAPSDNVMNPPVSPSKRWSPTKSSWLENAINKPDSPKVRSPAPPQPAWMSELNRAKQQRGSIDVEKGPSFKEVSIGGLVRSPPPGANYKPPTYGGLPSGFSAGVSTKARSGSIDDLARRSLSPMSANGADAGRTTLMKEPSLRDKSTEDINMTKDVPEVPSITEPSPSTKADIAKPQSSLADQGVKLSPAFKTKPETPPKKDFKTALKPRRSPGAQKTEEEPEFKNVFGNLKRTQTKNYVAPDDFKDNIVRGKAGLAQSAGPQKVERKDEFKESILQKKQRMVVPSASTRITSASAKAQQESLPEAIAKRRGLTRSESAQSSGSSEQAVQMPKPERLSNLQHVRDKPKSTDSEKQPAVSSTTQRDSGPKNPSSDNFTTSLAGILQRGPSPLAAKLSVNQALNSQPENLALADVLVPRNSSEGARLIHTTKARARGPKRRPPTASKQEVAPSNEPQVGPNVQREAVSPEDISAIAPDASWSNLSTLSPRKLEPRPLSNITHSNTTNPKSSQTPSPRKPSTTVTSEPKVKPPPPTNQAASIQNLSRSSPPTKQKPALNPDTYKPRQPSNPTATALQDTPGKRPLKQEVKQSLPTSKEQGKQLQSRPQDSDVPLPLTNGEAATLGQPPKPTQAGTTRSPSSFHEPLTPQDRIVDLKSKEIVGSGLKLPFRETQMSTEPSPTPRTDPPPKSPPLPGKKPSSITSQIASATFPASVAKQTEQPLHSQPSHASDLFSSVFDESPDSKSRQDTIDTQAVIDSCPSNHTPQKIKTLRKQIFQITDNGKSAPVPSHQEHILFDESLYLCMHVFGDHTGQRKTEVFFWVGDAASSSSAEDAQLFAKRFAREHNAKLIVLKQGKETASFFQALGGIVMIRRGSSNRAEAGSGAEYLLCGRQHVGQIAFDEVDYSSRSLCKGFPFILSAPGGKVYLWKGSGSNADELGCAKLVAMDLSVTGEIQEINDAEPDAFWEASTGRKPEMVKGAKASGQHWHLKPTCENYSTRLFAVAVETQRPKSASSLIQGAMQWGRRGSAPPNDADAARAAKIEEVIPYAQSDLVDDRVFVLDAFFEVFVIFIVRSFALAPHQKSTESSAFRTALLFAQEYGILAASTEDRPFVPISSVVICARHTNGGDEEGLPPEGMIRSFRKWDDGNVRECKVVPLAVALEAVGEQR